MSIDYPKLYLYLRIVQAKLHMDKHYAEKIDIDNISDEAYFSKYHFIRIFKSIYELTPHQYLISVRIANAQTLLKQGTSVSETCHAVGFESMGSFSALFKRIVKATPSGYLQQQQRLRTRMKEAPLEFVPACYASKMQNSNFEEAALRSASDL